MAISILSRDGKKIYTLSDWQKIYGVAADKVGYHFAIKEKEFHDGVVSELLICLLDEYRGLKDNPVIVNSLWRSEQEQSDLTVAKAKISPHPKGMAADLQCNSELDVKNSIGLMKLAAKNLGLKIRLGYKGYLAKGQYFIHVDVCPMYYAKGCVYNSVNHPIDWELELSW